MTVDEMIERLQEVAEDGFGGCEIRLAFQQSWPLQFQIAGVATPDDWTGESDERPDGTDAVVYIAEGNHPADDSPYAPGWVFEAAR